MATRFDDWSRDDRSYQQWERNEEHRERLEQHAQRRQQADMFGEWQYRVESKETADEREVRMFYGINNAQVCECGESLGMHEFPDGRCTLPNSRCLRFVRRAA